MDPVQVADRIAHKAVGIFFLSGFGTLWLGISLYAREQLTVAATAGLACVLAAFLMIGVGLQRVGRRWPKMVDDPRVGRAFHRINALQWVAIFVVATCLGRMHLEVYDVTAIAVIVGLHFFPLGRLFHSRMHPVLGVAVIVWAGAASLIAGTDHLQSVTAMGVGCILLTACAVMAATSIRAARQLPAPPASAVAGHQTEAY